MKRLFLLISIFLITELSCGALEIIYPKKTPAVINSASTFFIGSTNPNEVLKINGVEVKLGPNGAFAQVVPLVFGKNSFLITSESDNQNKSEINFVIERPKPSPGSYKTSELVEYPPMSGFVVKKDLAPIRTTPVDGGINRISQLPQGMPLVVNGEKNGFYRVFLNSKTVGWIDKSSVASVEKIGEGIDAPIGLKSAKCRLTKDYYIYEFDFEKKVPFALLEETTSTGEPKLSFVFYNVKNFEDNTFSLNTTSKKLVGYDGYWRDDKFILKVRRPLDVDCSAPLKGVKIALDAGHGGTEAGAIGCCGEKEKDINLAITRLLRTEIEARGGHVVMTRDEDVDVSLSDRVKIAREREAVLLLSIHANALPDGADPNKCRGTSVYYYHNQAKSLADCILNSMTIKVGTQNDKVRQGSLALVRPTASVSVLIEVAYIINPDDYAMLTDKDFQAKCAKAIADGIEDYLKK